MGRPGGARAGARVEIGQTARIGRYQLTGTADGLEVHVPGDSRLGSALAAGGLLIGGIGLFAGLHGRFGAAAAMIVIGIGIAAVGGTALLGSTSWRASPVLLLRERADGGVDQWPHEAIGWVAISRAVPSAFDFKRTGVRPWEVRVRGPEGTPLPTRFTLESEGDARALARSLAAALDVPLREGDG